MESAGRKSKSSLKPSDLLADAASKTGARTLCLICFEKWNSNMPRHATQCAARDRNASKEALRSTGTENRDAFNVACTNMRGSLFFSMRELEDRQSYTPYEVAELLRSFGHCAVPEKFEDKYQRIPVFNKLSERHFKEEVEQQAKRRVNEKESLDCNSTPTGERDAAIIVNKPISVSPSSEDDKHINDLSHGRKGPKQDVFKSSQEISTGPQKKKTKTKH